MSSIVILEIRVNNESNINEHRFACDMSIDKLKNRLELIVGASADNMELEFYDKSNALLGKGNDVKTIGDYLSSAGQSENRLGLVVRASNVVAIDLAAADVPKYEMPDDAYEQRSDSLRMFKMKNKIGRFGQPNQFEDEECIKPFKIGDRCEVTIQDTPPRRGSIVYLGKIDGKQGYFVGIRYDEPWGKNDGSIDGKRFVFIALRH